VITPGHFSLVISKKLLVVGEVGQIRIDLAHNRLEITIRGRTEVKQWKPTWSYAPLITKTIPECWRVGRESDFV